MLILIGWLAPRPADKVVFLDVGQGDAILLQEGAAQVLVDGGPGNTVLQRLAEELPWFDKKLDVIILTHPQRDHMEGLLHVLDRYDVGLVVFPAVTYESQLYQEWLEQVAERNVPVRFSHAGQALSLRELQLQVLGPLGVTGPLSAEDVNDASTVTRVDFCGEPHPTPPLTGREQENTPPDRGESEGGCLSFLLTGDAERMAENNLVETYGSTLDIDVLKAGHHGSNTSTHAALLSAASPSVVVISVGKDNSYGHPHSKMLQRVAGMQVWRTDEMGSVRFERVKNQWFIK